MSAHDTGKPAWGDVLEIEIRIHSKEGDPNGSPFKITANVYGEWAAHRGVEEGDTLASWWSVTHMPTGRALPQIRPTRDQAIAIAATVAGRLPSLATEADAENARHLIIPAVRLVMPGAWPGAHF